MAKVQDIKTTMGKNTNSILFEFSHGKSIRIELSELSCDIMTQSMLHGIKQKLGDAGAISRNPETGASASVQDKYAAIKEVYERLTVEGVWNKKRDGSGPRYGLLLTALERIYTDKTIEELKVWLETKSKTQLAALRINPAISPTIEAIRLERAGDVNTDSLLAELEPTPKPTKGKSSKK